MLNIACGGCGKTYSLDEAKVPRGRVQTTCKACGKPFFFENLGPQQAPSAAPPAKAQAAPSVPRPAVPVAVASSSPPALTAASAPAQSSAAAASASSAAPPSEDAVLKAKREALMAPLWSAQFLGYQFEKISLDQLRRWINEGRLKPEDMASKDGGDMQRADTVAELGTYFRIAAPKFALGRPKFLPPCMAHPQMDADMRCEQCFRTLCPDCAILENIGLQQVRLCKFCHGNAKKLEKPRTVRPFHHDLGTVLSFPFKGAGLVNMFFYSLMGLLIGVVPIFFALPGVLVGGAVLQAYNLRIFQNAVAGKYEAPGWVGVNVIEDIFRGFKLILLVVCMVGVMIGTVWGFAKVAPLVVKAGMKKSAQALPAPAGHTPRSEAAVWSFEPEAEAQEDGGDSETAEEPDPVWDDMEQESREEAWQEQQQQWQQQQEQMPQYQQAPPPQFTYPPQYGGYPPMTPPGMPPDFPFQFDPNEPPPPPASPFEDITKGAARMGFMVFLLLPILLAEMLFFFFYYPIAFMSMGLTNELMTALNVPAMLGVVRRVAKDYFIMLAFFVVLLVAIAGISMGVTIVSIPLMLVSAAAPIVLKIASTFINTYFVFLYYHIMGRVVETNPGVFELEPD
jgi:hypothetical protein